MKKNFHKYLLSFAMICIAINSYSIDKDKNEYRKEVKKNFSITSNAELELNTQFTSVNIQNWDKNEIEVFAEIIVEAKDEAAAEKIFNKVKMDFSGGNSHVTIKCELGSGKGNDNHNEGFEIIITIKAPSGIRLEADTSFGDLEIDRIDGESDIEHSFGKLSAENLSHWGNEVFLEFGEGDLDNLSAAELSVSFSEMNIDNLNSDSHISNSYGELNIDRVDSGVKSLKIENSFGEIDIVLNSSKAEVDATNSFGDVKFGSSFNVSMIDEGMFDTHEKATLGGGGGLMIEVSNSYGDVRLDVR